MVDYADALADYPHLVEVVGGYVAKAGYDYEAEFRFGLDVILDRFERFLGGTPEGDENARVASVPGTSDIPTGHEGLTGEQRN